MEKQADIRKRLDRLGEFLKSENLLTGKGLSNEMNIHIFPYLPQEEMAVRYFVHRLINNSKIHCCNLYDVFLEICGDYADTDTFVETEAENGTAALLDAIQGFADNKSFVEKMQEQGMDQAQLILLWGLGEVFPFMRLHLMLSALQQVTTKPIIALYPGEYTGQQLRLFNKLAPSDYYRAFPVL